MDSPPQPAPALPIFPWHHTPLAQAIALLLGIVPMYGLAILSGALNQGKPFQVPGTAQLLLSAFGETLFFGGIMLLLLNLICGDNLRSLQTQPGSWSSDILAGLGLFGMVMVAVFVIRPLLYWLGAHDIPEANRLLGTALANDPVMLAVFLGPLIWLKAALLEEFSRVFMLSRLWRLFPTPMQRMPVLVFSSLLFGAGHIWEGWQGVATTAVIGLVLGWHYMQRGRVLPLIIAHGLYDTLATVALVLVGSGVVKA